MKHQASPGWPALRRAMTAVGVVWVLHPHPSSAHEPALVMLRCSAKRASKHARSKQREQIARPSGDNGLEIQQRPLERQTPAKPAQRAVRADHPMARHDQRDWIAVASRADG